MADNDTDRSRERSRGRGRGAFFNFYKDMGTSSTEEGHTAFVKAKSEHEARIAAAQAEWERASQEYAKYQTQLDTQKSSIMQGQQQINSAQSELKSQYASSGNVSSFEDVWKNYNPGTPIRITSGNNVEATYKIGAPSQKDLQELRNSGVSAGYVDGGKNFNIDVRLDGGKVAGAELHQMMREAEAKAKANAQRAYEAQVASQRAQAANAYNQAQSQINQAYGQLNQAQSEYSSAAERMNTYKANLSSSQSQIQGARDLMNQELEMIKTEHKNKLDVIRGVLLGTKTELGSQGAGVDTKGVLEQIQGMNSIPNEAVMTDGEVDPEKAKIFAEILASYKPEEEEDTGNTENTVGIFQESMNG